MTDNMVEGRKSNDARNDRTPERAPGLDNALAGDDYPHRFNEANNPSDSRGVRNADGANLDNARGLMDRKTPIRSLAANVLPEGTEIACTLVNQLGGDNTGPVKVQVENDIPFPRTDEIAIPQGALFLGEAQKVSAQFQQRLAVSFHMLQIGVTAGHTKQISLDKFPGLDIQGEAALRDQVNNHYLSIFGASLAIGALGGLSQIGNSSYGGYGGIDSGTQVRNGISQSMAQSATQILNHFLNRPPTITIRAGHPLIVHLTANLESRCETCRSHSFVICSLCATSAICEGWIVTRALEAVCHSRAIVCLSTKGRWL
jgi:type IV secretory pathway VirB10-like protein